MQDLESDRLLNQTWSIRTITPFDSPWNDDDFNVGSSLVTSYFRDFVKNLDKVERDGTNVTFSWIHLGNDKFLFLDMYLADEPKAQVVLCFPRTCPDGKRIESFEFALIHGDSKWYQILLDWFEKTKRCCFSKHNIRLTSNHIERLLTNSLQFVDPEVAKLELTLATPRDVKNLDTISVTIPPRALHSIFLEIQRYQTSTSNDGTASTNHPSKKLSQTLKLFILQEFGIDVTSFHLIQISNPIAIFDANGKIRLHEKERINDMLLLLNQIIKEIIAPFKQDSTTKVETQTLSNAGQRENGKDMSDVGTPSTNYAMLEHITHEFETNFVSI